MDKESFKIGDKVKILTRAVSVGVEREDVGKAGVIEDIDHRAGTTWGIRVKMNEICIARGYIPTWSVGYTMIKLLSKKGEQLLFNFMKGD